MKITEVRTRVVQWEGKTVPLPPHFCTNPMDLVSYRAASMGNFAFHGWARNPNQWVAIASWKSEEILARLRETPQFQSATARMLACCAQDMTMEEFSGMKVDRSVFDTYPLGRSEVHLPSGDVGVAFL